MDDEADPIMEAVTALRAAGIAVAPIGDLVFSDADLWRLAASRGLVEEQRLAIVRRRHAF